MEFDKTEILTPYVLSDEDTIDSYVVNLLSGVYDREKRSAIDSIPSQETINPQDDTEETDTKEEKQFDHVMQSASGQILGGLLRQIQKHCHEIYAIYVPYYDDRYYRSSYSLYYYGKHFRQPGYCGRLFLFDGGKFEKLLEKSDDPESPKIFSGSFIGSVVKKPIPRMEIGRTLIDPRYIYGSRMPYIIRKAYYSETMYGIRLSVYAFPYAMQDGETVTCSEITIQNLSDYYSKRYQEFHSVYPEEISRLAEGSNYERNIPSTGMKYQEISKVLKDIRFSPKLYAAKYNREYFLTILHCYLTSGIPLAMGIDSRNGLNAGHSIIAVGQEKELGAHFNPDSYYIEQYPIRKRSSVLYVGVLGSRKGRYILVDDGRPPYTVAELSADYCETDPERRWQVSMSYANNPYSIRGKGESPDDSLTFDVSFLIAPLNREMVLDAVDAIQCFKNLVCSDSDFQGFNYAFHYDKFLRNLKDEAGNKALTEVLAQYFRAGDREDNPLLMRIFLCPSRSLKKHRVENLPLEVNYEWLCEYRGVHMPRYVWVCELYSVKSITARSPFSIGEIILDASSAGKHNSDESRVIMVNYPGKLLVREPEEDEYQFRQKLMLDKETGNGETNEFFDWYGITPFMFRESSNQQ